MSSVQSKDKIIDSRECRMQKGSAFDGGTAYHKLKPGSQDDTQEVKSSKLCEVFTGVGSKNVGRGAALPEYRTLTWVQHQGEVICVFGGLHVLLLVIVADLIISRSSSFIVILPWIATISAGILLFYSLSVDYSGSETVCRYASPLLFLMVFLSWFIPDIFSSGLDAHSNSLGIVLSATLPWLLNAAPVMGLQISCFLSLTFPSLFIYSSLFRLSTGASRRFHLLSVPLLVIVLSVVSVTLRYLRSCSDMTALLKMEVKRREEQACKVLSEKEKEYADKINKMRQFISYIFHEIRVPFNAVVLGIGHMLASNVSDELREILKMMDASSSSMIHILNDVLDMGKIEAGKLQLEKQPFNMGELVSSVIWAFKDTLDSKGIEFSLCVDPGTKEILSHYNLLGDKHRVRQVLANYFSNAAKFTRRGGKVTLRVVCNGASPKESDFSQGIPSNCETGEGQGRLASLDDRNIDGVNNESGHKVVSVTVSVEDTGIGISKEDQARLFEPYTQLSGQGGGGTGLGLCFAKRIVDLAGGNISVFSEVGKGSMFLFTMPFRLLDYSSDNRDEAFQDPFNCLANASNRLSRLRSFGRVTGNGEIVSNPRVLIVEDNKVNRTILRKLLTSLNIESDDAEDGKQAIELCRNGAVYDMILIDKEMPVMDGHEATRELRALGIKAPIIGLTGNALDSDRNQFLAAGVDDFFTKPISRHQLVKLLESYRLIRPSGEKERHCLSLKPAQGTVKSNGLME